MYDEPPAWYYPGCGNRKALVFCEREGLPKRLGCFAKAWRRSPRNGRMLFGLVESLKAQRKFSEAALVKREFDAAWTRADVRLRIEDL